MWPSARSGFQLFVYQDEVFLYGGYSKEVVADKNGSEKGIVHSDLWSLDPRTWEWNKIKKTGMPPGPRAGFSLCVHKKRAVLFGGVVDMEVEGDVLMSLFMNELYGFQLDSRRWYPLELRKDKSTKNKLKKPEASKDSLPLSNGSQDDVEMSIADDGNEDMEYEEAEDVKSDMQEISHHMTKSLACNDVTSNKVSDVKVQGLSTTSCLLACTSTEAVKPCGRINACMVVGKDTLYLYGGMMEIRDREITLDDLYSLNLSKLDEWKCIIAASESEWQEVSDDDEDDDSDDESNSGTESNEDDSDEDDDEMESEDDGEKSTDVGNAVSIFRGEKKNLRRKEKRARIEQIRVSLGLSDSQRTPVPGETLKDFYRRTNMYWQMAAHEHTQHTGKELRKDGFDLAEARFKELKPILDELAVLEAEQKAEEAEGPETSLRTRGNKKNKQRNPQR
ncbi:kelch domain-containing protein 4 [Iris pallida]|nr:kelch domain-containing protein 4 [Iris pallida]